MKPTAALLLLAFAAPAQDVYDVILSGGRIVDGTGNAWFLGDLAITGNRIAKITGAGLLNGAKAKERIDARGLVVAPGFVDIQGALGGPSISKITQGVTTEIAGEGWTPAPSNDLTRAGTVSTGRREAEEKFDGPHGFDQMLQAAEKRGSAVNFGSYVGATTVRQYVKGMAAGKATPDEIRKMQELVSLAMEDGAFGIGSALIYPPAHRNASGPGAESQTFDFKPVAPSTGAMEYRDPEFAVSVKVPQGWKVGQAFRWGDHETTARLIGPENADGGALYFKMSSSGARSEEEEYAMLSRNPELKAAQRVAVGMEDYRIRLGSVERRTVGGRPALSCVADFTRNGVTMAEYLTWVSGEHASAQFFAQVAASELDGLRHRLDSIIETLNLP
jgi:hypothetical protein